MNNAGRVLIGFAVGAAAGAIAGVLMAPDKGDSTRSKLTDKSMKARDDFNVKLQQGIDRVNSLTDTAFNLINRYKEMAGTGTKAETGTGRNIPVQD